MNATTDAADRLAELDGVTFVEVEELEVEVEELGDLDAAVDGPSGSGSGSSSTAE